MAWFRQRWWDPANDFGQVSVASILLGFYDMTCGGIRSATASFPLVQFGQSHLSNFCHSSTDWFKGNTYRKPWFLHFLPSNLMGMMGSPVSTFHNFPIIQVCEKTIMLTYSKSMTYIDTLEIFHRFSICFEHFGMTLIPSSKHTLMLWSEVLAQSLGPVRQFWQWLLWKDSKTIPENRKNVAE